MVRGQSIEFRIATSDKSYHNEALLSGKYISPLPEKGLVLVGATHEFQSNPLSQEQVIEELRERTLSLNPILWNDEANIERFTMGVRVQSQRGAKGRLPLIGRLDPNYFPKGSSLANAWIFTGLSSRGLLYHGVYGALLAQAILDNSEDYLSSNCPGFDWWDLSPK